MHQFVLTKAFINFLIILFLYQFINSQPIIIMSAKLKIVKKKYSNKTILIIFILYSMRKLHKKIANYIKIPKLIVIRIL